MFRRLSVLLICAAGLVGCASTSIDNLHFPYRALQNLAKKSSPLGVRTVSRNGREVYSQYFAIYKGTYRDASKLGRRSFSKISILGGRRPYEVSIEVFEETRHSDGSYSSPSSTSKYVRRVKMDFERHLAERRKNPGTIDDFKVF